jgi:polysaccharide export outer membrane protein
LTSPQASDPAGYVPVIYQVNLKRPEGFFMAQAFQMRDHDVVYVANADTVQLDKMFHTFAVIATIPKTGSSVAVQ